jgi:hypothetical protein
LISISFLVAGEYQAFLSSSFTADIHFFGLQLGLFVSHFSGILIAHQ